jgi:hypothetical protein
MFDADTSVIGINGIRYFACVWMIGSADVGQDVLMSLCKDPDGMYKARMRARLYNPESIDPSDGKDFKTRVLGADMPGLTEEQAIEKCHEIAKNLHCGIGGKIDFLVVKSADPEVIVPILQSSPWFHIDKVIIGGSDAVN